MPPQLSMHACSSLRFILMAHSLTQVISKVLVSFSCIPPISPILPIGIAKVKLGQAAPYCLQANQNIAYYVNFQQKNSADFKDQVLEADRKCRSLVITSQNKRMTSPMNIERPIQNS